MILYHFVHSVQGVYANLLRTVVIIYCFLLASPPSAPPPAFAVPAFQCGIHSAAAIVRCLPPQAVAQKADRGLPHLWFFHYMRLRKAKLNEDFSIFRQLDPLDQAHQQLPAGAGSVPVSLCQLQRPVPLIDGIFLPLLQLLKAFLQPSPLVLQPDKDSLKVRLRQKVPRAGPYTSGRYFSSSYLFFLAAHPF